MNNHNATCPKCQMILRDVGPSGDPWEQQIKCPECSGLYHISCTGVGTSQMWQKLGKYKETWKCHRCFVQGSKESEVFYGRVDELSKKKEQPKDDTKRTKGLACGGCFEELRDKGGRLIRRVQCPGCSEAFHFSCTEIGDESVWQQLGDYRNMWKCTQCFGYDSKRNIIQEKIKQIKEIADIPINIRTPFGDE